MGINQNKHDITSEKCYLLDQLHPRIEYTVKRGVQINNAVQKINFLDIKVLHYDNKAIKTDIFYKTTITIIIILITVASMLNMLRTTYHIIEQKGLLFLQQMIIKSNTNYTILKMANQ